MAAMPQHPEAFCEQVRAMLERLRPDLSIDTSGPNELVVDGRRLDLDNLYRMVIQDPDRGVEIVEQYLDHLFAGEAVTAAAMPSRWRSRIMPRIQPESIFQRLSRAGRTFPRQRHRHRLRDRPAPRHRQRDDRATRPLGRVRRGPRRDSRKNLRTFTPAAYRLIEHETGGKAAVIAEQDGYDAARLLLNDLHKQLAPRLGATSSPRRARDVLVAVSATSDELLGKVHEKVERDYRRMPYPISSRFFFVTRDGVAGTDDSCQRDQAA